MVPTHIPTLSGFPEVRYHQMAEALARAGYRVVVVEQVGAGSGQPRVRNPRIEQYVTAEAWGLNRQARSCRQVVDRSLGVE